MSHSRDTPARLATYHRRAVLDPKEIDRYTGTASSEATMGDSDVWMDGMESK